MRACVEPLTRDRSERSAGEEGSEFQWLRLDRSLTLLIKAEEKAKKEASRFMLVGVLFIDFVSMSRKRQKRFAHRCEVCNDLAHRFFVQKEEKEAKEASFCVVLIATKTYNDCAWPGQGEGEGKGEEI